MGKQPEDFALYDAVVGKVSSKVPGFEIRYKDESWSSKLIAALCWIFNRRYMTDFTTTRYPRVYFPSQKYVQQNPRRAAKILSHEFVHLWDRKQKGRWFSLSYALPQIAGVVLLLTLLVVGFFLPVSKWWIALAIGVPMLYCLAPTPAYWRMRAEMRGYAASMAVNYWRYGFVNSFTLDWIAKTFTGPNYYFMWPFRKGVDRRIADVVVRLEAGTLSTYGVFGGSSQPYRMVKDVFEAQGILKKN